MSAVLPGSRWLIAQAKAPWKQAGDVAFTVVDASPLTDEELAEHDLVTQASLRGVEYATLSGDGGEAIALPCSMLLEVGEPLP